jgi:hypothetical protein
MATRREVTRAVRHALPADNFVAASAPADDPCFVPLMLYRAIASSSPAEHAWHALAGLADGEAEQQAQSCLLRDIFGNPFRPLQPRPTVIAPLAEEIYAGQWELMPLLGEWLQERGFGTEGEHCLDPRVRHVKRCYVVDWLTARE